VDVFLTIDTETYPLTPTWRETGLREDLERDVYGRTRDGEFGLEYQLQVLRHHKLRAVFMTESLFASVPQVGPEPLCKIIAAAKADGHDVQVHPHPEWLPYIPSFAGKARHEMINRYTFEEQKEIISLAISNLERCGAAKPRAFRAGDYAANADTLRALLELGIVIDSSYNPAYIPSRCRLELSAPLTGAKQIEGVWEMPISFFEELPARYRPAQLGACSTQEMSWALEQAYAKHWKSFVIVSNSFEFLKNRRTGREVRVRSRIVKRFEDLCAFLDTNRDRFQTATFAELMFPEVAERLLPGMLRSNAYRTVRRMGEQLMDRVFA